MKRYLAVLGFILLILSCATTKSAEEQKNIPNVPVSERLFEKPTETGAVFAEKPEDRTEVSEVHPEPVREPLIEIPRLEFSDFVFIIDPVPVLTAVPGVGFITRERRDLVSSLSDTEKAVLTDAFKDAYTDGLLRNQGLAGVLGGDQVHGWPEANPVSWAQNWQISEPKPNSWGLPSLFLAVSDREIMKENEQYRVFTVQGDVLDFYGRGAGVNGANGNTGFGSPRGQEFFYQGKIAQRFDHGLIVINEYGKGSFRIESPVSQEFEEFFEPGFYTGSVAVEIHKAFVSAWKMAVDSGLAGEGVIPVPDGPVQFVPFTGDSFFGEKKSGGEADGFYIQTYNNETAVLILPSNIPAGLPRQARFLGSPFLGLLTMGLPLAGTEEFLPAGFDTAFENDFLENLTTGLEIYGLPLTDPVFRTYTEEFSHVTEQRFTRGWIRYTGIQ